MSEDNKTTYSHRITFYVDGQTTVSTDTNTPEPALKLIEQAISGYYRRWWQKRTNTTLRMTGNSIIVIPIARIQCFKIEEIGKRDNE